MPWYHIDLIKNKYYYTNTKVNRDNSKKVIESFEDFKIVDSYFPVDRTKKIELLKDNMQYVNYNFDRILDFIIEENTKDKYIDKEIPENIIDNFKILLIFIILTSAKFYL